MADRRRPRRSSWSLAMRLAARFLLGGRSRLLIGTTRSALLSTALGVAAMTVAMALMTGYTTQLQAKLLENGAVVVYPQLPGGFGEDVLGPGDPRPEDLLSFPEVTAVERAVYAQGSLSSEERPAGLDVMLRGVTPRPAGATLAPLQADAEQLAAVDGVPGVVLGRDLATRLGAGTGDRLRLVVVGLEDTGPRFRYRTVRVAGTFATGFAEFDRHHVVAASSLLEALGRPAVLYEVATTSLDVVDRVYRKAQERLGSNWVVTDWRRQNPGLFTALRLQKWALFLTLGLIVVVSTFNVASTLLVLVREKTRDVGVLGALGLRPRRLEAVFVLCGLTLGGLGTLVGLAVGGVAAWVLTTYRLIRFDSEVASIYFIDSVPFVLRVGDLLAVAGFTLGVTLLASWLPARRAARIDPSAALRYE